MRNMRKVMLFIFLYFLVLTIYGCGSKMSHDGKVIARINKYELTADDFKDEARLIIPDKYPPEDIQNAKSELLEEMIIKNILIQEAQAQNFDKDKAFMKEIERYWEQALLKLLFNKKTEEFSAQVTGPNDEVKKAKVQKMLENWVKGLRKHADVKIYKENLQEVQVK